MITLDFDLIRAGANERRSIPIRDLVIAGWTGRDPHKVQEHIEELAALGVAPPPSTPCFYRAGLETLTTAPAIDCLGGESSGEAEFVIVVDEEGAWWVGLGSDHTDRKVESYSITVSKQMCPKPVGPVLWAFEEVADHWDRLELRSWVDDGQGPVAYQEGSVAAMRDPRDTVAAHEAQGHGTLGAGALMFGGTLPAIGGIRPRRGFRMELRDPVLGRAITHEYTARWLAG
jgi:hypothetical protein